MNGIHFAMRTGSRVLVICSDAPNASAAPNGLGPDYKTFPSHAVLQAAGFRTFVANHAATARHTLLQAAAAAHDGGVVLLLPANVQQARIDPVATAPAPVAPAAHKPASGRPAAIAAAAGLLARSRKPLLLVGWGAHRAGAREAIIRLADHLGAALATTMKAKDMFRGHPFNCDVIGGFSHQAGRRLIEEADCVVVIGAGMNSRTTSMGTSIPADIPLIQVDARRSNIGRWFHADVAVVGDAKRVAEQLLEAVPARAPSEMPLRRAENARLLAKFRLEDDFTAMNTPRTLDARTLALALDRLLPVERNLIWDSGNLLVAAPYLSCPGPAHFKQVNDTASISLGFGTAMGFAIGTPERTTVLIMGDGSLMMTLGELETVAREAIPLVIVVMNDCAYGAELHFLKERNTPTHLSQFPDVDYAPVAEAFGIQAATIRTLDDLRALAPTLANPDGALFLDCKINASVMAGFLLEGLAAANKA
jgi:thiamine pyrophosphate-dependent acetolactate synthase large subunit-like protein